MTRSSRFVVLKESLTGLEDWIIENASEDDCLLYQVPLAARNFMDKWDSEVLLQTAKESVRKLVTEQLIVVSKFSGAYISRSLIPPIEEVLGDRLAWEPESHFGYGATSSGIAFNEFLDSAGTSRASTRWHA